LLKHNLISNNDPDQILLGSSAGSLISASIRCDVPPELTLDIASELAKQAHAAGPLTALTPGFSLIDALEPYFRTILADHGATDATAARIKNMRVHLTQTTPLSSVFSYKAHAYLDKFPTLNHLIAACILSSYVPLGTGPLTPSPGDAVTSSSTLLASTAMQHATHGPLPPAPTYYDGGLAAMWPLVDAKTLIVSPVAVKATKGNICICPPLDPTATLIPAGGGVDFAVTTQNLKSVRYMIHPGDDDMYAKVFEDAYEDARRVCREKGIAGASADVVK